MWDVFRTALLPDLYKRQGIERLEQTGETHIVNGKKIKARKKTSNELFETQDSISYWEDVYKRQEIIPG